MFDSPLQTGGFASTPREMAQSHVETLLIYKLGFNQDYYTFVETLLVKNILCSKIH